MKNKKMTKMDWEKLFEEVNKIVVLPDKFEDRMKLVSKLPNGTEQLNVEGLPRRDNTNWYKQYN